MELFHPIHFVGGVIYIHLCGMWKTKFQIKGVVFGVYFVVCSIASEKVVEVVIRVVCVCKKVLQQMPESFREMRIDGEVQAF